MPYRDDDHDDIDDREYPEPDDEEERDVSSLMLCPYCRKYVHEDTPRCHHCGNYPSAEDAPSHKPLWVVITVLVCLGIVLYFWVWRG